MKPFRFAVVLAGLSAMPLLGANQYWDLSASAGLQHGNGNWSATEANWSSASTGTALAAFSNTNGAFFSSSNGTSTVTLETSLTSAAVTVNGSVYTLVITNGGQLVTTADSAVGSLPGMNGNGLAVAGGGGPTSLWNLSGLTLTLGNGANTATGNYLTVDGGGTAGSALVTNLANLLIFGDGSALTVANGGVLAGGPLFTDFRLGYNSANGVNGRARVLAGGVVDLGTKAANRLLVGDSLTNNVLTVDGGLFTNVLGTLLISGTNSGLIVTNGGRFHAAIGTTLSKSAFLEVNGGTLSLGGALIVAGRSRAEILAGSQFRTAGEAKIGSGAGQSYNTLRVAGGSTWNVGGGSFGLSIGETGAYSNSLVIDNALVTNAQRVLIASSGSGFANSLTITNGGRLYENTLAGTRDIGNSAAARDNQLVVAGGPGVVSLWEVGNVAISIGAASSTNNQLRLDGKGTAGSAWVTNAASVAVAGISNGFAVLNGGTLFVNGLVTLGSAATAWGNRAELDQGSLSSLGLTVGAASGSNTVSLRNGSVWDLRKGALTLGTGTAMGNSLSGDAGSSLTNIAILSVNDGGQTVYLTNQTINGAGASFAGGALNIGTGPSPYPASLVMADFTVNPTGGPSGGLCAIGVGGASNTTVRLLSGSLWNGGGQALTLGANSGSTNALLTIDGEGAPVGATVTNMAALIVGSGSATAWNRLVVTNGGRLFTVNGTIGNTSTGNLLRVQGGGARWNAGAGAVTVGNGAGSVSNSLAVDGGGTAGGAWLTNAAAVTVGASAGSAWNTLIVTNGGRAASAGASLVGSASSNNLALLSGGGSQWSLGGFALTVGSGINAVSNALVIDGQGVAGGAQAINVAALTVGLSTSSGWNRVVVTNGGRLFSSGVALVGSTSSNNTALATGPGSLWDLGSNTLTLGNATSTNNTLVIDQDGTVDTIGTLTVWSNNAVLLRGGTLGVMNWTLNHGGPFTVGDGAQSAALKVILGGGLTFSNGLAVSANAALAGNGTVSGAASGASLAPGSFVKPGTAGAGALTIGGTGLTWNGGAAYVCEVTSLVAGASAGWDLLTVATNLAFVPNTSNYVIRVDSLDAPAAGFNPQLNYALRILGYGSVSGYDPARVTLDAGDFQTEPASSWFLTNFNSALWLVYTNGSAAPGGASWVWSVPNSGTWSAGANWQGGVAPAAGGDPTNILYFGDNGTPYNAGNNLGAFALNQLLLASAYNLTNVLSGTTLVLTNNGEAGAHVDYLTGPGTFIVSNTLALPGDSTFGGDGMGGGVVSLAGAVTNAGRLTKQGAWTLALGNTANTFSGPLVVDSPGGGLRLDHANALNGTGDVVISNGLVHVPAGISPTFAAAGRHNRRGYLLGSGSVWSNSDSTSYFKLMTGVTNAQFVVDGGRFLILSRYYLLDAGSANCRLIVTNGGYLYLTSGNVSYNFNGSTNCEIHVTGSNSILQASQAFFIGANGTGNTVRVEKGGALLGGGSNSDASVGGRRNRMMFLERAYGVVNTLGVRGMESALLVSGTGTVFASQSASAVGLVASTTNEYGNTITVADQGVLSNYVFTLASQGAYSNTVMVTNGGRLVASAMDAQLVSGYTNSYGNRMIVSGPGSVWSLSSRSLTLCAGTGTLNRITVEAGGLATNLATLVVAAGAGSTGNGVTVDGGTLAAATISCGNALPNDLTLTNGGVVTATSFLYVTNNPGFKVNFNGGTLNLKSALVSNGLAFVAGDGAAANTLNILPGGTNVFADGLAVTNLAALTGSGLIQATTTVFGALSPGGTGVGTLTNNGTFTLAPGSEARLDVAAATTPGQGWDFVVVTNGPLTVGGLIRPVLSGGFVPTNTQRFVILTNAGPDGVTGVFDNASDGGRVNVYSNDTLTVLGWFRVGISNQYVVLNDFQPVRPSRGTLILLY